MKRDLYQEVTDKLIAQLEKGVIPWRKPWKSTGIQLGNGVFPINFSTKKEYNGINIVLLWCAQQDGNFQSNCWLTFKQAKALGGSVKKGEKSPVSIVRFGRFEYEDKKTGEEKTGAFLKAFAVFNIEQCENLPGVVETPLEDDFVDHDPLEACELFIQNSGATIKHGGNRAFFTESGDYIQLPHLKQFSASEEYYSTAFHELVHWTGHKSRLNRLVPARFGDKSYSYEELVAEMGASFTCALFGIENTLENSAAYLNHWIEKLKENNRIIVSVASSASKAVDYLRAKNGETETEEEAEAA